LDNIAFSKIFYDAPLGTCVVLPNGKLAEVNDAFLQITGYSREEIFNIPIQDLTHPDDREMNLKFVRKVLNNTLDDYELEKRYLRKDGITFWAQMYVRVVRDSQKVLLYSIVMIKDITEKKELRGKLIDSERMAEIGKMISHLSHAIKSPISVIEMNVDFLNHECAEKNCFSPILPVIQKELKHIDYLLQQVLNYSRHNNLHCIKLNIHDKVETIIQGLYPVLKTKQIKIINKIDNRIINADAQKIHSLFLTLIENSIDAIVENGIIEFSSECSDNSNVINIFIRDTGTGFDNPEYVFKPFYTTKSLGTGMGLAIAKNIIEDHHGSIELVSAKSGNTIFKFTLPLAE
jgi:PAS domain S-box-containing protein